MLKSLRFFCLIVLHFYCLKLFKLISFCACGLSEMLPYSTIANKSIKTIYINPNFKGQLPISETIQSMPTTKIPTNAHVNPLFLNTSKFRNSIHMNPAFFQKLQGKQDLHQEVQQKDVSHNEPEISSIYCSNNDATIHSPGKKVALGERKIICKSKNCLIREPLNNNLDLPIAPRPASVALQPLLILNKRKLIRKVSLLPDSFKRPKSEPINDFETKITKYKLDNRLVKKKPLLPPTPRLKRTSFVGRYALRRSSFSEPKNASAKMPFIQNKNKKLEVLNINGLFYKSTRNSLKLKGVTTNRLNKLYKSNTSNENLNANANQGLTIFVRGTKYVMDSNKFKLTRVTNCDSVSPNREATKNFCKVQKCQRIDIGGYTYISTNLAKNILVRTSNHVSRAYVHNAKQRSLQTLAKRFIKTNIPCPIFTRIGKCAAFERGKCSKVHNQLQIAICSKFLRGECHESKCLLSHNVSLSKMPVCKFYLQGVCVRNDCPYLHKKLSNAAELCEDFLRGFCQMADKCDKRHEFICPDLERNKICNKKNCLYCNTKRRKESQIKLKPTKLKNETASTSAPMSTLSCEQTAETQPCKRYFVESCENSFEDRIRDFDEPLREESKNDVNNFEESTDDSAEVRPKLGDLPAYIPL